MCATVQGQERRQNPVLYSIPVCEPFGIVGMDFKEVDESFNKNHYALVFQDYLTNGQRCMQWQIGLQQLLLNA